MIRLARERFQHALWFAITVFALFPFAPPPNVIAEESWKKISLPHRPMDITNSGKTLWVCGTDEMIATSKDDGLTWQVKHESLDGEVLVRISLLEGGIGFATGTHGAILVTEDGGENWTRFPSGAETVREISFSDRKNGLRSTDSGVQMTHDGANTWSKISAYQDGKELEAFKVVAGLAQLDPEHAIILFRSNDGSSEHAIASTEDAGKTWSVISIPSTGLWAVAKHDGEFWMFGYEVIEKDKPGGGYGVALSLHSKDGKHWIHGVRAPNEFSECTVQGCILWDGAIVELYGEKPTFRAVPADGTLMPLWASTGTTICSVNSSLECVSAPAVATPTPRPHFNRPSSGSIDPFLGGQSSLGQKCLSCRLPPFPLDKRLLTTTPVTMSLPGGTQRIVSMPGMMSLVEIEYTTRKNGTIGETRVKDAPNKQIQIAVSEVIKSWVMVPPQENGVPREEKDKLKLRVSCMASPFDDEALCTLLTR
ncbi:MAG TPA: YCF48-related protein [Candidatus Dormibacteraeota bacterium]|nr:YCF48-related protein [Candidatus Dormibacteraeota bacterium]